MGSGTSVTTIPFPNINYPGSSSGYAPVLQQHGSTSISPGISLFSGGLLELLPLLVVIGILGIFVILIVANRAEPDPSGNRPRSVYFFAVALVTLTIAVNASIAMVIALVLLIGHHKSPIADNIARVELLAGLLALVSMVLFVSHVQRGLRLAMATSGVTNPSKRVAQSYVGIVSFISIFALLLSVVASVYVLFAIISPGVFGSLGGKTDAARDLVVACYIALVALTIILAHRNLVPPGLFRSSDPAPGDLLETEGFGVTARTS